MKTTLLRPGLYVTLKYSNFATKYFKNKIVLIYYFVFKSSFYSEDVSVSYFIFALVPSTPLHQLETQYPGPFLPYLVEVSFLAWTSHFAFLSYHVPHLELEE